MPVVVEVIVPDGVLAGDSFLIEFDGQQLEVTCPKDCFTGDCISMPVDVPESSGVEQIDVVVPDGCFPGMEFAVAFDGREFNLLVPEGCEPGSMLTVDVPPRSPDEEYRGDVGDEAPAEEATPLPAPPLSDGEFASAGDTVIMHGLQTKPLLNGERASLISWDAIKGRWKLAVGCGSAEEPMVLAIKPENLRLC
uniref:Uncharacterized protein n=1 Tax=Prymnesium polylepis TaxID=72548 RepID=A0A7S4HMG0_9EUKA